MAVDVSTFASYAGHVAAIAVALAVLAAAPRQTANRGFAIYVLATTARPFGFVVADTIGYGWDGDYTIRTHVWWTQIVAAVGLVLLARAYPTPLTRADRSRVIAASGIGTGIAALWILWGAPYTFASGNTLDWIVFLLVAGGLPMGITAAFLALLALRARHESGSMAPHGTVTVAIVLPWALEIARRLGVIAGQSESYPGEYALTIVVAVASLASVTILWLRNLHAGARSRWALAAAWSGPAIALAGVLGWSTLSRGTDWAGGASDATRIVATAAIAFAIARGQVPGLASRVRWTVSRGTIAATFVAVFFVASEAAQQFLGDTTGSTYLGIAAAGALVFAIAPLQRAAERLAEKAVPVAGVATMPERAAKERLAAYRLAVEAALRDDGRLTEREETHLADLAQALGVGAGDALRVRREVEARAAHPRVEGRRAP